MTRRSAKNRRNITATRLDHGILIKKRPVSENSPYKG
jgi:hypothetical protein